MAQGQSPLKIKIWTSGGSLPGEDAAGFYVPVFDAVKAIFAGANDIGLVKTAKLG